MLDVAASFDAAVGEFVALKGAEGLPGAGFGFDAARSRPSRVQEVVARGAASPQHARATPAAAPEQRFDVLGYYMLRRWLTRCGREATAGELRAGQRGRRGRGGAAGQPARGPAA